MTLRRDILRPEAAALLDVLGRAPELEGLTLMGGTALALQIGHRISLDFDFAVFGGTLPGRRIEQWAARLRQEGHRLQLITSPEQAARFKINTGLNLLDYARDYVIDGVKLTFFVHGRTERQEAFYRDAPRVREPGLVFDLLGIEGLKVAKTLVLADRARSRDLYDLHILIRDHGYTLDRLFETVRELGTVDDPEHYKAVLRGEIPLDRDDEGLEPVGLAIDIETIYAAFNAAIDEYEIAQARAFFRERGGE